MWEIRGSYQHFCSECCKAQWRSQSINGGGQMFDLWRITLFCLEKRLSKHEMTTCSKNLGAMAHLPPLATPMPRPPRRPWCCTGNTSREPFIAFRLNLFINANHEEAGEAAGIIFQDFGFTPPGFEPNLLDCGTQSIPCCTTRPAWICYFYATVVFSVATWC